MTLVEFHDFLVVSGGVAGALIGLLFVAGSLVSLLRVRRTQPGELRDGGFLVGVARAWELIGGPSIGLRSQLVATVRDHDRRDD